jgi:hypothetical protein
MPNNFLATYEYVVGGGTTTPRTGARSNAKTTEAITELNRIVNPIASQMSPGGNAAMLISAAAGSSLTRADANGANFSTLVLGTLGVTMDLAVSTFTSTGTPPSTAQVSGFYYSSKTIPVPSLLDVVIPRYVSAMFIGGEG